MTKRLLKKLLKKWIKILKLSPPKWEEISIDWGAENLLPDKPLGFCTFSFEERRAQIFICNPESYTETYDAPFTIEVLEKILIHELLHLVLYDNGKYKQTFEQGLNVLTDVLWDDHGECQS